jgi:hypothetical protein
MNALKIPWDRDVRFKEMEGSDLDTINRKTKGKKQK